MNVLMALVVGLMVAAGLYLMMRRRLLHLLLGVALLGNGVNLMIITAAGLTPENPPLIHLGEDAPRAPYADPLPQALVLTAIVIGFGVLGFAVALAWRTFHFGGDDDLDQLRNTESQAAPVHHPAVASAEAEVAPGTANNQATSHHGGDAHA